ncbi:hypothetical protein LCGC14_2764160 [marine sediment metagenome]|uniref:Uncharacterized protein n=1 Tax=marine sediment metagenome TaxID=412755 RepID=A0A0F8YY39_9ZZZZ
MAFRIWIARRFEKLIAIILQRRVMVITEEPIYDKQGHLALPVVRVES